MIIVTGVSISASLGASQSASVTVSMTVPSATNISIDPADPPTAGACLSNTPGVTDLGIVLPGANAVSTGDCQVAFGSSNDTAMLRVSHTADVSGAMVGLGTGVLDPDFDGDAGNPNFPGNGWIDVVMGGTFADVLWGIDVQDSDGKIVAVGVDDEGGDDDATIMRFDTDGTLDLTFGTGGITTLPNVLGNDVLYRVRVADDGTIVAVGTYHNGADTDFMITKFDANGVLDPNFDGDSGTGDGVVVTDISGDDEAFDVRIDGLGGFIVVGATDFAGDPGGVLARYLADGTLDQNFDGDSGTSDGVVTFQPTGQTDYLSSVTIAPDSSIVAGGQCGTEDFFMIRTDNTGVRDLAFDGPSGTADGQICQAAGGYSKSVVASVTMDGSGDIIAGGYAQGLTGFVAYKTHGDGTWDVTFDGNTGSGDGIVGIDDPASADQGVTDIILDPAGRIVLAGAAYSGFRPTIVMRLLPDGRTDNTFNDDGIYSDWLGAAHNSVHGIDIAPNGKIVVAGTIHFFDDLLVVQFDADSIADYSSGVNDWAPTGSNLFGVCLRAISGASVAADWTVDGDNDCQPIDSDPWMPIPNNPAPAAAKIMHTTAVGTTDAIASLRFGVRTATNQPQGTYVANVVFQAVAPNV